MVPAARGRGEVGRGAEQHHRHHTNGDASSSPSRWPYSQAPLQTAVWQRGEGGGLGPVFPTPKCQGRHQGGRGSPAPARTSARSGLRVRAADRPPLRSARRCLCRDNVGYERVYSPTPARPSSRSRASAWRAHAAIRAHQTRAPRQGEARAPQSGYARASSPHAQGPGGLPLVLLDCSSVLPSRARTQEGPLGARRWRSPLLASGQYVADACARGGRAL
jgi:hypothetical protein